MDAGPDSSTRVFTLPEMDGLSSTYFVSLRLESSGDLVSRNFYWLSTQAETLDWARSDRDESGQYQISTWTPTKTFADYTALEHSASGRSGRDGAVGARRIRELHHGDLAQSQPDARLRNPAEGQPYDEWTRRAARSHGRRGAARVVAGQLLPAAAGRKSPGHCNLQDGRSRPILAGRGGGGLEREDERGAAVRCHPEALRPAVRRGIRNLAWTVVAVSALPLALTSAEPPAPFPWPNGAKAAVVLSYDDGVDVHLDYVAPDLEAAGLRGTFFVPGHSESLAKRFPEWRALAARGHELGNHAIFHPCLRTRPPGRARLGAAGVRARELHGRAHGRRAAGGEHDSPRPRRRDRADAGLQLRGHDGGRAIVRGRGPPALPGRADRRGPDRRGRARSRPDARPELDGAERLRRAR